MEQVKGYYKKFVTEGFDENGILNKFELSCPDNFNFSYDIIDKFGEIDPDRRALLHIDLQENRHEFSYLQLSKLSTQAANLFASKGIKKGDMVMLILKRNYQFWIAIFGLIKLGAIAIPATHLLTTHDLTYRFERASVKAVVCTGYNPDIEQFTEEAEAEMGIDLIKFIANGERDGWINFDEEIKKMPETMERVPTDSYEHMLLYFTSGTTGYPKMVIHNHRYALAHIQTAAHWHNVDPDGIHLTVSDTGWGKAAWGKLFGQMACGTCIFVYDFDKFVPTDMLRIMQDYKITTFCAPPTMFRFFIKEGLENYDLSSLKYSTIAGEALNPEVYNKWLEFTGLKLMEAFGQTESTALLANLIGMTPKPGSMGKPTPLYDVDVVDDDGNPVPVGEVGEIVVRAEPGKDGLFECYYRDEELTKEAWHDGLYHTGDTAWKDEDGYFWYVGRNDDVIKASGYRIGPFEIESVLISHPSVLECAVTGAPDPNGIRGQVVKATVVLARGYTASEELKKELQNYVKKNTAPYKYPRIVEFVDELPKTISGKIRRVQIRNDDNK
ncbi:MAG: AMP-binding protein [Eubacterium sp.]|nr:AMP-binding protein [Eubacterium sp.]